jgi:RNA polymerase sigma-70 factor (ECF subfamily)
MRERPMSAMVTDALREAELRRPEAAQATAAAPALAPETSVNDLARAAVGGSVEAVARLYDALVDPIYRYVAVRVHSREDAEDITQLVFERIVTNLPRYRPGARPFEAWAFRIARNAVIDHVRRSRAHEPLDAAAEHGVGDGLDSVTLRGEELRELRRALASLTPDQQEALALRYAAGLSAEEAAQVMGRRAGTIRGLTFRAITSLRRHFEGAEERS